MAQRVWAQPHLDIGGLSPLNSHAFPEATLKIPLEDAQMCQLRAQAALLGLLSVSHSDGILRVVGPAGGDVVFKRIDALLTHAMDLAEEAGLIEDMDDLDPPEFGLFGGLPPGLSPARPTEAPQPT